MDNSLIEWLKKERAEGFSEQQLSEYLLAKGNSKKDTSAALKQVFSVPMEDFSFLLLIKSFNPFVWLLFLASFAFCAYFFDQWIRAAILLGAIFVPAVFTQILHHAKRRRLAEFVPALSLVGLAIMVFSHYKLKDFLSFYTYDAPELALFVAVALVFFHSIAYYLKIQKKHPLQSIFLALFVSLTFAVTLDLLLLLAFIYLFLPLVSHIGIFTLTLLLIPLQAVCVAVFLILSSALLKRVAGEFDYDAFFRWESGLGRIFNTLSCEIPGVRKTALKTAIILSLTMLVLQAGMQAYDAVEYTTEKYARIKHISFQDHDLFLTTDQQLKDAQIVKELELSWADVKRAMFDRQVTKPEGILEKLQYFYSGKTLDDLVDNVLFRFDAGLRYNSGLGAKKIIESEYGWIKDNQRNYALFYDKTMTLQKHLVQLKIDLEQVREEAVNPKYVHKRYYGYSFCGDQVEDLSFSAKTLARLQAMTVWCDQLKRLEKGLVEVKNATVVNDLANYEAGAVSDITLQDTVLRLKLIEVTLAYNTFMRGKQNCSMWNLPKSPYLCQSLCSGGPRQNDLCLSKLVSVYDPYYCFKLPSTSNTRQQCVDRQKTD